MITRDEMSIAQASPSRQNWLIGTALLLLFGITSVSAQPSYERVLIPIAIASVPGAFGSVWTSQLWAYNSDTMLHDFDIPEICLTECPQRALNANQSQEVPFVAQPASSPGLLAFVQVPAEAIKFNLRVQDLSRQAQTWGTEVPVVRERDFLTQTTQLLNVPSSTQFRLMLRVYDVDSRVNSRIQLRVFNLHNGLTLGTMEVSLTPPTPVTTGQQYKPSYAQVSDLTFAPDASGQPIVGLEVIPLTAGLRYWVFVSVTNNETQHVTTITPQ